MVYKGLKEEDGYTLVEMLMALAILSVIISLVSVSFIFVSKRMADWKDQISFYNQFMINSTQIYNDLMRADHISYSDTTLLLLRNNQKQRRYSWTNGRLKLDHNPIGEANDSTWIKVEKVSMDSIHTINYWITYKREDRIVSDSAIIQIREPIEWTSVNRLEVN